MSHCTLCFQAAHEQYRFFYISVPLAICSNQRSSSMTVSVQRSAAACGSPGRAALLAA